MWKEEGKDFKGIVHRAVSIYNDTPLDRKLGSPKTLWGAGREGGNRLVEHARLQREVAN